MSVAAASSSETPPVPLPRIAGFVRQVTHDVRNTLNSLDLQAAYLLEIITDDEALEELRRMRSLIHTSARQLQGLSSNFWSTAPSLIAYYARILVEDLRDRIEKTHAEQAARIDWQVELGDELLSIDIELLFGALTRLFENAWTFAMPESRLVADVYVEQGRFFLEIRQALTTPASDPARWGYEPFVSTRRGAYGLGVFRARSAIQAQGGELVFSHDSGSNLLLTRVSLPLATLDESSPDVPPAHRRY